MTTLLLLLASPAFAGVQPIRFELSETSPSAGDRVYFRAAWTNDSTDPVRVPADIFDHLRVRALVEVPWEKSGIVYEEGPTEQPDQRLAAEIGWRVVPPFTTIERIGDLSEFIPQCRDGCVTGDYQVRASVTIPPTTGLAVDQQVPAGGSWNYTMEIRPPVLAVHATDALRMEVANVQIDKNVATLTVRLNNTGKVDAWFPDTAARLEGCSWSWTRGGKTESTTVRLQGTPGAIPWHEPDALLVPAGASAETTVTCTAPKLPGGGKDATVSVTMRPTQVFVPMKKARTPFWFAGERTSEPGAVKP